MCALVVVSDKISVKICVSSYNKISDKERQKGKGILQCQCHLNIFWKSIVKFNVKQDREPRIPSV